MTSVLYFLHLKTLDILLLIVNINVADFIACFVAFYLKKYCCNLKINLTWKNVNFQQLFVVVKNWKEEKPKWSMDLFHSVIYLLYNSK